MIDEITVKYEAPSGYKLVKESEFKSFQDWQENQDALPEVWTLKEFAQIIFHRKGTTKALNFLLSHRDDLDIRNGGFINYDQTHGGWSIPADLIKTYRRELYKKE